MGSMVRCECAVSKVLTRTEWGIPSCPRGSGVQMSLTPATPPVQNWMENPLSPRGSSVQTSKASVSGFSKLMVDAPIVTPNLTIET